MVAALRSLRQVEAYTSMLSYDMRRATGISHRISDSKLRDELLSMEPQQLREALHRQVKAEHRRGNLVPSRLPIGLVAIDGKCLAKLDDWGHWDVQAVRPAGETPYGLARVHRAHLVSAKAAVCIDERPIPGNTNELGAVCEFTSQLIATYNRTELFEAIIADAGNCSLKHARQLVRVERLTTDRSGVQCSEGNRYFVTNLPTGRLDGRAWLQVIRAYWRIENNGNWTADAIWNEDARRTPWCRVPTAVFSLSLLRMIAMNVVAVLRALSRAGYTSTTLQWATVVDQIRALLMAPEPRTGENMKVS